MTKCCIVRSRLWLNRSTSECGCRWPIRIGLPIQLRATTPSIALICTCCGWSCPVCPSGLRVHRQEGWVAVSTFVHGRIVNVGGLSRKHQPGCPDCLIIYAAVSISPPIFPSVLVSTSPSSLLPTRSGPGAASIASFLSLSSPNLVHLP